MTWRIEFEEPARRLSMNDRTHWALKAKLTDAWRTWACIAAHTDDQWELHAPPCFVRVTFPVRDNRRRDSDNPAPTVKAIVDGLVDAGVWPDDSPEWVETLGSRFAKGADQVVVELIPRNGEAA